MNFWSEFREGLAIALEAIRANKLRSVLTTLGIIIGVTTVTLMGMAIEGLNSAFVRNISFIGADVLYVSRFDWFIDSHEEWMRMQKRRRITSDQAQGLEQKLTLAKAVAPVSETERPVEYKKRRSEGVRVVGATDQLLMTSSVGVGQGRFLSPAEVQGGRPVCVIGTDVATNLFQRESALGKSVRVGGTDFEVVGVMEKQGSFLGLVSLDNQIIVPFRQFTASFWNDPDCMIQVKAADIKTLDEAREELRMAMRTIRRLRPEEPDDFSINQQDQFLKMFQKLGGTIASVGLFVTGLSLFVGGIGIMNIMFVSVAERTREIGIRKAIGARRRTIMTQFLLEAAGICLIGGMIALSIAFGLMFLVRKFMPVSMSPLIVAIALVVSILTGVLSGYFPALRAARMNVVDALRNE